MNKVVSWVGKLCISGTLALLALSLLCVVYYNQPIHYESESGATDYYWERWAFYSRATEGFAFGKIDARGFNNAYPQNGSDIDVLLMGSSHAEAFNVLQSENIAYRMNEGFRLMGSDAFVYNIGISGHTLPKLCNNLRAAIAEFSPVSYVIMETSEIKLNIEDIWLVLNNAMPIIPSTNSGLLYQLQKIPYARLFYHQMADVLSGQVQHSVVSETIDENILSYSFALNTMLEQGSAVAAEAGVKLVIVYHPTLALRKDGTAYAQHDSRYLQIMREACETNSIFFIDMTDVFIRAYELEHVLPHGFWNTKAGIGHLNAVGHALIANELVNITFGMEESK